MSEKNPIIDEIKILFFFDRDMWKINSVKIKYKKILGWNGITWS